MGTPAAVVHHRRRDRRVPEVEPAMLHPELCLCAGDGQMITFAVAQHQSSAHRHLHTLEAAVWEL